MACSPVVLSLSFEVSDALAEMVREAPTSRAHLGSCQRHKQGAQGNQGRLLRGVLEGTPEDTTTRICG